MGLAIEGSDFNLLDLDGVIVTQSGSETLSSGQLAKLYSDSNEDYEVIWGYCVQPIGGLAEVVSTSPTAASFVNTLDTNDDVIYGNLFKQPEKTTPTSLNRTIVGLDFGSDKEYDYISVGHGGIFGSLTLDPHSGSNGFALYESADNSNWTRLQVFNNNEYWSSAGNYRLYPVTLNSSRYVAHLGDVSVQPIGTTQVVQRVTSTPLNMFAYNTTLSGYEDYSMSIDLGDEYDIFSVEIEDESIGHRSRSGYTVRTSTHNISSHYETQRASMNRWFMWYEADENEYSPVTGVAENVYVDFYNNQLMHNSNDNCLYLYHETVMYKFDLNTRVWSTLATNNYVTSHSSTTLDIKNNEIYGVGDGILWKYSIYKNDFKALASQPVSLGTGNLLTVTYSPGNHSLYASVENSQTFYRYDINSDTWSSRASISNGYFRLNNKALYCEYDNSIYHVASSINTPSTNQNNKFFRYSIDSNSWTDYSTSDFYNNSISSLTGLEIILDSTRQVFHFFTPEASVDVYPTFHVKTKTWFGYTHPSRFGSQLFIGLNNRDSSDDRTSFHPNTSACYVKSEDRFYAHGEMFSGSSSDLTWNRHLRASMKVQRLYSNEYLIQRRARYIKIQPSSVFSYPLMMKKIRIKPVQIDQLSNKDLYTIGAFVSDTPTEIDFVNNTYDVVYSGMAFFAETVDNYFEVSDSISGPFSEGPISLDFPEGLAPGSGFSLYVRNNYDDGVQRDIKSTNLKVLLEGNPNG